MKKEETKKIKKTNEAEFKSFDKLDLSNIKGSVSEILTTNFEKFNDCKTAEDVINLCHQLFDDAGLKTEWTNKFFYRLDQIVANNLNPRRAYQQAMLYVNNARMKGAGLGMNRGKIIGRLYEDDENVKLNEARFLDATDVVTVEDFIKYLNNQFINLNDKIMFRCNKKECFLFNAYTKHNVALIDLYPGKLSENDKEINESAIHNIKEKSIKKKYTKKQICEAIEYWKKQLKKMDESRNFDSMAKSVLPAFF